MYPVRRLILAVSLLCLLVLVNKDEAIVGDLVQLYDAGLVGAEEPEHFGCGSIMAVRGMLYADESRSRPEGLAEMVTVVVAVIEAAGLTPSEKKTRTMLLQKKRRQSPPHR